MNTMGIERLRALRNRLIAVYTVLAVIIFTVTCGFLINAYFRAQQREAMNFTSIAAGQTRKSVSSFLDGIERSVMVVFENTDDVAFYPRGGENEYDDLVRIDELTDKMQSVGMLQNYCDFGIVYRSGETAGKITNSAKNSFGDDLFAYFDEKVSEETDSGWFTVCGESVNNAYYLKKLNDNAVMIASIYLTEFDTVFEKMDSSKDLRIYLTDENGTIIYVTENADSSVGDMLPAAVSDSFGDNINVTVNTDDCIGSAVDCDGWKVYCVTSGNDSIITSSRLETGVMTIAIIMIIAFISVGYIASASFTGSGERNVRYRSADSVNALTGLLSGMGVEEEISDRIETCLMGSTYAFMLVKIKDFDILKERLGSEYTDDCLKRLGDLLSANVSSKDIIGINELNEFIIFADFSDFDLFKAHNDLKKRCELIKSEFEGFYAGENQEHKIYTAMGVCVYPDNGKDFDELYEKASKALDLSMKAEKDSCIFYDSLRNKGGADDEKN